ncbi:MAG: (d)CMP kinase, partial [Angelakisella sp.]|nr:(d)CMP kinase [Angelakisella sp.]
MQQMQRERQEAVMRGIGQVNNDISVIALDGRAAAGKSTLAAALAETLQAAVIHMDDFFLPP